ncbi:unnamed protein product [Gulo gulo]|uniref:Uncharacterized protein n=1 Tax=Gulo gulo TaxID=48420 RepID=A0A9X9PUL2_GULGU|nr:unnamed protein product [Gulo gulo]
MSSQGPPRHFLSYLPVSSKTLHSGLIISPKTDILQMKFKVLHMICTVLPAKHLLSSPVSSHTTITVP